jgi:hypothetical protein
MRRGARRVSVCFRRVRGANLWESEPLIQFCVIHVVARAHDVFGARLLGVINNQYLISHTHALIVIVKNEDRHIDNK